MVLPPNWRSPTYADNFADHDFADFAQEFLRRNPDYQEDYQAADKAPPSPDEPAVRDAVALKWGLVFRLRSRSRSPRRTGSLAPRCEPRSSHPGTGIRCVVVPGSAVRPSSCRRDLASAA